MSTENNRQRWPWVADLVDDLRQHFGPGVKVACIREAGVVVAGALPPMGSPLPDPAIVAQWREFVQDFEKNRSVSRHSADFDAAFARHCEQHWRG